MSNEVDMFSRQIGTVTVTEPFRTTQHHQYAAAWTLHEVQPGTYRVTVLASYPEVQGHAPLAKEIAVDYDTVIVDGWKGETRIGQHTTYTVQLYAYRCPDQLIAPVPGSAVDWLGGRFTPCRPFEVAEGRDAGGNRTEIGVTPVVTRDDLPPHFREEHLPAA